MMFEVSIGVGFWFCLGGGAHVKFSKLGALKLHFQHPENTFGEIFYVLKTTFSWCIL